MTGRARWIGALAALTVTLTGCGDSHPRAVASRSHKAARIAAASNGTTAQVRPGPSVYAVALPLSPAGPTTCTVYEPGGGTQIVFDSQSLNVRVECQLWASSQQGAGYLWGYERAAMPDATRVCSLRDPQGKLTANVIEQTHFVQVSAANKAKSRLTCASIAAAGWVEQTR